jgi:hypothetical protein
MISLLIRVLLISCCFSYPLFSEIRGKIDIGPTLLNVDILESGKTVETLHMKALKGDATILVGFGGLCLKPGFMIGTGHGEIASFSIGVGHYTPLTDKFSILPNVGINFSYLRTHIDFEALNLFHLKERFRSVSPFIGIEFAYQFLEKWTLSGLFQYAWCRTHTKISPIVSDKSHSNGPNYSLGLDYSFNKHWSLSFGVGYNITLSKEKHGIRGKGAKIGVAYYF